MKEERATLIEKQTRLFMIQSWLLDGVQDRLIIKQISVDWNLSIRQCERYIKEAYQSWKKVEGVNIEMKREMKLAELKQVRRSLKEEYKGTPQGIQAIMLVEREIIKLEGIEPDKNININTGVKPIEFIVVKKEK